MKNLYYNCNGKHKSGDNHSNSRVRVCVMLTITMRHWFVELKKVVIIRSIRSRSFDTETLTKKHFPGNWYCSCTGSTVVTLGVNKCDRYKWLKNENNNNDHNNNNNNRKPNAVSKMHEKPIHLLRLSLKAISQRKTKHNEQKFRRQNK